MLDRRIGHPAHHTGGAPTPAHPKNLHWRYLDIGGVLNGLMADAILGIG